MPSRAEPVVTEEFAVAEGGARRTVERVLRGFSLLLLALLVWQALHALRERPASHAEGEAIPKALARWSTSESPAEANVVFDSATVPPPEVRDWLAALRRTGTRTSWYGPALGASAIHVSPVADPKRPVRIWVAAPRGSAVKLRDQLGIIDSTAVNAGAGVVFTTSHVDGDVRAILGDNAAGSAASAVLRDSLTVRPVLVLGIASWESKFVLASLQEHGWTVDARFGISPKGDVRQGAATIRIDTSRYAAVIAVDSSAAKYARTIGEYVRSGGGFIAVGEAASLGAFTSLLPGSAGAPLERTPFEADSAHQRNALALAPIRSLKEGAVALESRDARGGRIVAVAAQRVGRGRVLQVGYVDDWQWRMGGIGEPASQHRDWWSRMVSSVAYAPRSALASDASVEPTPVATLVAVLGPPVQSAVTHGSILQDPRLLPLLFALLMTSLFAEWASRRLRGAP